MHQQQKQRTKLVYCLLNFISKFIYNLNMTQNKNRNRAQSARPHADRHRPLSSRPNQANDKTGFIQKVYANIPPLHERPSSGRQKAKIHSMYTPYHLTSEIGGLQKEALAQENMQLKKRVNILQEQVTQMHGRIQANRSKNSKLKKALNVEFQNQNLWTGSNAYLVAGVKNQYQKLKSQFRQKCEQLTRLQQTNPYTNMKQLLKENQILKKQNANLIENYLKQQIKNGMLDNSSDFMHDSSGRQLKANSMVLTELRYKQQQMEDKLQRKNQEITRLKENLQADNSRVKFLEKLIIEKDNSLHAFHSKNKKLQKQKHFYTQHLETLNQKLRQSQEQNQERVRRIQQSEGKRVYRQREIYTKAIEQRNFTINKLEKEVAYLTTLMSYWKPLDEEQRRPELEKQASKAQTQKDAQEERKGKATKLSESFTAIGKVFSQRITQQAGQKQKAQQVAINEFRQQKTADVKRSQASKKVRRVKQNEVQDIGELIRFRLISQRIPIETAKSHLNYTSSEQVSESEEQWQKQYITMKQLLTILKSEPFFLSQEQSTLLSRYMIEDVMNDFVYCDEANQNKREIVKSILKNSIGDYQLEKNLTEVQTETNAEMQKYKKRISIILQQLHKDGVVSKKKLVEIFVGSGFEIRSDVLQFIVGQLAMQSKSLEKLDYRVLF